MYLDIQKMFLYPKNDFLDPKNDVFKPAKLCAYSCKITTLGIQNNVIICACFVFTKILQLLKP